MKLIALLLLPVLAAAADAGNVPVDWPVRDAIMTWRVGSGLRHQHIQAITQTEDGWIWVGTAQGLSKFDGLRFSDVVVGDEDTDDSISIRRLAAGRGDRLWVGTGDGVLWKNEAGSWEKIAGPDDGKFSEGIEILAEDASGTLWITTNFSKVWRLADGHLQATDPLWKKDGWGQGQVRVNGEGQAVANGAAILGVPDGDRLRPLEGGARAVMHLAPGADGSYWVSDASGVRLLKDGELQPPLAHPEWGNRGLNFGVEDGRGNLWLATKGFGILGYGANGRMQHYGSEDGLCGDYAECLYCDRQGNLWIGSNGGGLSRVSPAMFDAAGRKEGLSSDRVTALATDDQGKVWIGTLGDGLNLWDGSRFSRVEGLPESLAVRSLANGDGILWIGTAGGLVLQQDDQVGVVGGIPQANRPVLSLLLDRKGTLWAGRQQDSFAVTRFQRIGDQWASEEIPLGERSSGTEVVALLEDRDGSIWIGTLGGGLFRWKKEMLETIGELKRVVAVAQRSAGGVWVAADERLWIWQEGHVKEMPDFPEASQVETMLEDDRGGLWLGGTMGIRHLRFENGQSVVSRFGPADGMPELQGSGVGFRQSLRDVSGRMWFATTAGALVFDPGDFQLDGRVPDLEIVSFTGGGEQWQAADFDAPVEVQPGARGFAFELSAIDPNHPDALVFATRIDGVDPVWREGGREGGRQVFHATLPPGKHVFRAKVRNHLGNWSPEKSLAFTVRLPLWQRGEFIAAAVFAVCVLIGGAGWLIHTWRTRAKMQALEIHRALEVERSRIAMDLHDDLGSGLTQIAFLSDHVKNSAPDQGDIRESAKELSSSARALTRSLDETVWALNPAHDSVEGLTSYLGHAVESWVKGTGIRHRFDFPDVDRRFGLSSRQRQQLLLASKEVVNNTIKHSGASEVQVSLSEHAGRLRIVIRDDGDGFDDPGSSGNGLQNIEKRLREIGGKAIVRSAAGQGTTVELHFPLTNCPPS